MSEPSENSIAPITTAFGLCLCLLGVMTHWTLSILGFAFFMLGLGLWVKEAIND